MVDIVSNVSTNLHGQYLKSLSPRAQVILCSLEWHYPKFHMPWLQKVNVSRWHALAWPAQLLCVSLQFSKMPTGWAYEDNKTVTVAGCLRSSRELSKALETIAFPSFCQLAEFLGLMAPFSINQLQHNPFKSLCVSQLVVVFSLCALLPPSEKASRGTTKVNAPSQDPQSYLRSSLCHKKYWIDKFQDPRTFLEKSFCTPSMGIERCLSIPVVMVRRAHYLTIQ